MRMICARGQREFVALALRAQTFNVQALAYRLGRIQAGICRSI